MDPASFLETFDRRVAAFWTYWASLPRAGAAPHLRDYLDRVPPDLQPSVLISDFYAADRNELRLIGTVMAEVMGVDTDETSLGQVYDRALMKAASNMSWTALHHPCGYAAKRPVRSRSGRATTVAGIALPLITDRPVCKTLVNFSNLDPLLESPHADDRVARIQSLEAPIWIDIGYGVPQGPTG